MRIVRYTKQFKKDYKREKSGQHAKILDAELTNIVTRLSNDQSLDHRHFDHALAGNWNDHRDCHVRPDLVLIYRKTDDNALELVRIGSHSELSL